MRIVDQWMENDRVSNKEMKNIECAREQKFKCPRASTYSGEDRVFANDKRLDLFLLAILVYF